MTKLTKSGLDPEKFKAVVDGKPVELYVLTNKSRMFGAACMLYPGVFQQAAREIEGDFFVLPSSVHEVLLLSPGNVFDREGLRRLVREINETQVEPYEVLSNNVYYYDSEKAEIRIA